MTLESCLSGQLGAGTDWYVEVLSHASQAGHAAELVRKVQQDVSSASFNRRLGPFCELSPGFVVLV